MQTGHTARPVRHYVGSPVPTFRPPKCTAFRTRVYDCRRVGAIACQAQDLQLTFAPKYIYTTFLAPYPRSYLNVLRF